MAQKIWEDMPMPKRYLVGDTIKWNGMNLNLLWMYGRTPEGKQIWDAEDENTGEKYRVEI